MPVKAFEESSLIAKDLKQQTGVYYRNSVDSAKRHLLSSSASEGASSPSPKDIGPNRSSPQGPPTNSTLVSTVFSFSLLEPPGGEILPIDAEEQPPTGPSSSSDYLLALTGSGGSISGPKEGSLSKEDSGIQCNSSSCFNAGFSPSASNLPEVLLLDDTKKTTNTSANTSCATTITTTTTTTCSNGSTPRGISSGRKRRYVF